LKQQNYPENRSGTWNLDCSCGLPCYLPEHRREWSSLIASTLCFHQVWQHNHVLSCITERQRGGWGYQIKTSTNLLSSNWSWMNGGQNWTTYISAKGLVLVWVVGGRKERRKKFPVVDWPPSRVQLPTTFSFLSVNFYSVYFHKHKLSSPESQKIVWLRQKILWCFFVCRSPSFINLHFVINFGIIKSTLKKSCDYDKQVFGVVVCRSS
jgi:hypothetical protein